MDSPPAKLLYRDATSPPTVEIHDEPQAIPDDTANKTPPSVLPLEEQRTPQNRGTASAAEHLPGVRLDDVLIPDFEDVESAQPVGFGFDKTDAPKTPPNRRIRHIPQTDLKVNSSGVHSSSAATVQSSRSQVLAEVWPSFKYTTPICPRNFLDSYLPLLSSVQYTAPIDLKDRYGAVADVVADAHLSEPKMYEPLVKAFHQKTPGNEPLLFTVTSGKGWDLGLHIINMRPDVSAVDHKGCKVVTVEVKKRRYWDPVRMQDEDEKDERTSDADEGDDVTEHDFTQSTDKTLSQIADYARCMFYYDDRTRAFTVAVFGDYARLFLWDRAAVVVSKRIYYASTPELLDEFWWRMERAEDSVRGFDDTIKPLSEAQEPIVGQAIKAWQAMYQASGVPIPTPEVPIPTPEVADCRKISIKAADEAPSVYLTLGAAFFKGTGLFSRATRCWLALKEFDDPVARSIVVIKDSWLQRGRMAEKEFYDLLQGVSGIASLVTSANFSEEPSAQYHRTITTDISSPKVVQRDHRRTVLGTVGRPLEQFRNTKELVTAIRDAVRAHGQAVERDVLHQDISTRNILLSYRDLPGQDEPCAGFLIDFDYSSMIEGPRNHDSLWQITGTAQFMAVERLIDARSNEVPKPHLPWHDLESFFWVLLFIVARYTNNPWNTADEEWQNIARLFDDTIGDIKENFLHHPSKFQHPNAPLRQCIKCLALTLSRSYPTESQEAADVKPIMPTHAGILEILNNALDSRDWPENDGPVSWVPPLLNVGGVVRRPESKKRKHEENDASFGRTGFPPV